MDFSKGQQLSDDSADFALKAFLLGFGPEGQTDVTGAANMLKSSLDKAVANNTTEPDPIKVTASGLKVVEDGLTLGNKPTLAADVELAETLVENFETNGGHPIAAGIKTFFTNLFGKKKAA